MDKLKYYLIALSILASLLTTGCSSTASVPVKHISSSDVDHAMSYQSYDKRQSAIKSLLPDATSQQRVGLMTLLVENCVAQAPIEGLDGISIHPDRQACVDTAAFLKQGLDKLAVNYRPDSALVLIYLVDKHLNGLTDSTVKGLDGSQLSKLNNLCGQDQRRASSNSLRSSFDKALNKSCVAHIKGDIDEAMLQYARAQSRSLVLCMDNVNCNAHLPTVAEYITRSAPWEAFKARLLDSMGIALEHNIIWKTQ
ncbi:MAG: hypothetical protein ACI9YH_000158 [Colwellia sp.]|jgi:hypothetical protein